MREQSGVNLKGQITGIGPRLFQIEQRDAARPTEVFYADVARIRCGAPSEPSRGPGRESRAGLIVAAVMLTGVFIGIAVCGEGGCNNSNKPTQATQ